MIMFITVMWILLGADLIGIVILAVLTFRKD